MRWLLLLALLGGCATVPPASESGPPSADQGSADAEVAAQGSDGSWRL